MAPNSSPPTPSRHPRQHARVLVLAVLCLVVPGCGLVPRLVGRYAAPQVHLDGSRVRTLSRASVEVDFVLAIDNPNPYTLSPDVLRYRVQVNDTVVAQGVAPIPTHLAPGTNRVQVSATLSLDALQAAAPRAMMLGEIPYTLAGSIPLHVFPIRRELQFIASGVLAWNLPLGLARPPALRRAARAV